MLKILELQPAFDLDWIRCDEPTREILRRLEWWLRQQAVEGMSAVPRAEVLQTLADYGVRDCEILLSKTKRQ